MLLKKSGSNEIAIKGNHKVREYGHTVSFFSPAVGSESIFSSAGGGRVASRLQ